MGWTTVMHDGEEIEAKNFLDGVLVRDPKRSGLAYCEKWIVTLRGDMDAPNFRKLPGKQHVFGIELREKA